jgi:hypothetical protein
MRLFKRAIGSVLVAAVCMLSRSSEAAEPSLALGPVAYAGEIPDYFQREVEQTLVNALESSHGTIFELRVKSCQRIDCLLEPAREAKSAAVILARISKRDRDYVVELLAHAVDDGVEIANVTAECSVCGQRELLDMLPAELVKLRAQALEALSERALRPRLEAAPELEPTHARRSEGVGLRAGGWVATWLGVGALGTGVALLVLDGRPHQPTCAPGLVDANGACPNIYTTAGAGYAMLGVGIASLGVGIGLLVHGYRQRDRPTRVQFGPGPLQLRF